MTANLSTTAPRKSAAALVKENVPLPPVGGWLVTVNVPLTCVMT
jgi:hypothetical protein